MQGRKVYDLEERMAQFGEQIKEVKEVKHFLRMMAAAAPSSITKCREFWKKADELNRIFSSIIHNGRKSQIKKDIQFG